MTTILSQCQLCIHFLQNVETVSGVRYGGTCLAFSGPTGEGTIPQEVYGNEFAHDQVHPEQDIPEILFSPRTPEAAEQWKKVVKSDA